MLKLETLFAMSSGHVLNFTNQSFQRFIKNSLNIDIYDEAYMKYGASKAKRLRAFWEMESDVTVGKLIEEIILYYQAQLDLKASDIVTVDEKIVEFCSTTASKLQGKSAGKSHENLELNFLDIEIDETSISSLNLPDQVIPILEQRVIEIKKGLKVGASLSVIFLAGSVLEGLLLNVANKNPGVFNKAKSSPKDKSGQVKTFRDWALFSFIDVSYEVGYLGLDVKKHSHSLRDFRNYIHPFEQMNSEFFPDIHTAEIAWKVLKAAMHDLKEKTVQENL